MEHGNFQLFLLYVNGINSVYPGKSNYIYFIGEMNYLALVAQNKSAQKDRCFICVMLKRASA